MLLVNRSDNFSNSDDKYKFTGKERDVETGYDYFGARYYDSRIGRWLQVDPLLDIYDAYSSFCYSINNPIKYFDPSGKYVRLGNNFIRSDWTEGFIYPIDYVPGLNLVSQGLRSIRNDPSLGTPSAIDYLWNACGGRMVSEGIKYAIDLGMTPLTIQEMTDAARAVEIDKNIFDELLNTKSSGGNAIVKIGDNENQIIPTAEYAAEMGYTLEQAANNIEQRIISLWKKYDSKLYEKKYTSVRIKTTYNGFFSPISTANKLNKNILLNGTYLKSSYDASSQ